MFNPLVDTMSSLSDEEIEGKIADLSRKYFLTKNPSVQTQISSILDMYREELYTRKQIAAQRQKEQQNGDNDLDNLIKIS